MTFSTGFIDIRFAASDRSWAPPSEVRFALSEYMHDVVTMVIPRDSPDARRYNSGQPVSIKAANSARVSMDWFGYVNHVEPAYSVKDPTPNLKVYCIGASGVMRETTSRTWKNRTIPSVINEVVTAHRFAFEFDQHDTVWPALVQHGESDWKFITGLAQKIGYSLIATGVSVSLKKRSTSLERAASAIPVLSPINQTIDEVVPVRGAGAPQGGDLAVRESWAVDPRRGQAVYRRQTPATGQFGEFGLTPIFNRIDTNLTSGTVDETTALLTGAAEANRLYLQARTIGRGDFRVRPGGLVFLRDVGTNDWGYWYVQDVAHTVASTNHSMELTLGRDSVGTSDVLEPPVLPSRRFLVPRLLNGKWVA